MGGISNPSTGVPSPVSGVITFTDGITLGAPSDLGTPSALVGTNISGTAAGLNIGGNSATATTSAACSGNAATATTAANNVLKDNGVSGVGQMAMCKNSSASPVTSNATIAGSSLNIMSISGALANVAGAALTGTWRNISPSTIAAAAGGIFQRIA